MLKQIFASLLIMACLISCDKDEEEPIIPDTGIPLVYADSTYGVKVEKGIEYAKGLVHSNWNSDMYSTKSLTLDIYEPDDATSENRPAIVIFHGGGFYGGDSEKETNIDMANHFASRGWVAICINYRLHAENGTVPQAWIDYMSILGTNVLRIYPATRDAKASVRWLYANAENYKVNTNYITVGGGSAGCNISLSLGITEPEDFTNELTLDEDPTLATTHLNQPSKVHTIIDFWGGLTGVDLTNAIYGVDRYDSNDPPALIVHGTDDPTVSVDQAYKIANIYDSLGIYNELYLLQGRGHGPWDAIINGVGIIDYASDFVIKQQNLKVVE